MRKNILLLNPPGDKLYLRDCYCTTVAKANYYWHPLDLLIQSGILAKYFNIFILDASVLRLNRIETLRRIFDIDLDVILFLTGSISWKEDLRFIEIIKKRRPLVKVIGSGEILRFDGLNIMKQLEFIDAILLDFTSNAILEFLRNNKLRNKIDDFIYRFGNEIFQGDITNNSEFGTPIPKHELFSMDNYKLPFGKRSRFASILSSFGCPYKCKFCNTGTLGFKRRHVDNFMEELKYIQSLRISKIFIRDATFGADRRHTKELCEKIIKNGIKIEWNCFSRVDLVDEELLTLMKKAGCYLIQFGVESGDEEVLKKCNKLIDANRIIDTFKCCKRHKIDAGAHFILGLFGENHGSVFKTLNLIKSLDPAYVSFNILNLRFGSPLRDEYIRNIQIHYDNCLLEDSHLFTQNELDFSNRNDLIKLRKEIIKRFYFRPKYIWHKFSSARSLGELLTLIENGVTVTKDLMGL